MIRWKPSTDQYLIPILIQILWAVIFSVPTHAKEHPPFRLGLNLQAVAAGFDLEPLSTGSDDRLTFRPAKSNYLGVIAGWRWLAGSYSFKIPADDETRAVEGESDYRDFRLGFNLSNLGIEASYTRYKGYLIDPSSVLSPSTLNGQMFYKLPELETLGYGLNFLWVPNRGKYNLAAALDQSEIQDESGGAWIVMATWRYQKIQSNYPWIPGEKRGPFGVDQDVRYAVLNTAGIGGGYGVNWVPTDLFFLSALFNLTAGYQSVSYVTSVDEQSHLAPGVNAHLRIILGVNVEEWIFTLGGYLDYFNSSTQSVRISPNINGGILTGVVRF